VIEVVVDDSGFLSIFSHFLPLVGGETKGVSGDRETPP
jgi:hypothetical protein